jgi:hypothetical protein
MALWGGTGERFCDYDPTTEQCDVKAYVLNFLYYVVPPIGVGLLATVLGLLSLVSICVAKLWCGESDSESDWWQLKRYIVAILLWCLTLLAMGGCIGLAVSEGIVNNGFIVYENDFTNFVDNQLSETSQGLQELVALPWSDIVLGSVENITAAVNNTINTISNDANNIENIVHAVLITKVVLVSVFLVVLFGCLTFGLVITAVFRKKQWSVITYWVILIVLILPICVFLSSSILIEGASNDLCLEYDIELSNATNSALSTQIINCGDSIFHTLASDLLSAENQTTVYVCGKYADACQQPDVYCPPSSQCQTLNETQTYFDDIIISDCCTGATNSCSCLRNVSVTQCAYNCTNQQLRDLSSQLLNDTQIALEYEAIIDGVLLPVAYCEFVQGLVHATQDPLCNQIRLAGVSGVLAVIVLIPVFAAIFVSCGLFYVLHRGQDIYDYH